MHNFLNVYASSGNLAFPDKGWFCLLCSKVFRPLSRIDRVISHISWNYQAAAFERNSVWFRPKKKCSWIEDFLLFELSSCWEIWFQHPNKVIAFEAGESTLAAHYCPQIQQLSGINKKVPPAVISGMPTSPRHILLFILTIVPPGELVGRAILQDIDVEGS